MPAAIEYPEDHHLPLQLVAGCQRKGVAQCTLTCGALIETRHTILPLRPRASAESIRLTTVVWRHAGVWISDDRHHRPHTLQRPQGH